MNFWPFRKRVETREAPAGDPYWSNAAALQSGAAVTPKTAQGISACYACVAAISETIASLPLILYRRTDEEGRERAREHPLYRVLHEAPNERQSALEFREQMQAAVLLRGNAYAEIQRGHDGQVRTLLPLHPGQVQVLELDNGRLAYEVTDRQGRRRRLLQEEVFHLRHRSEDGALGVSPIQAAREVFELTFAQVDHGLASFRNGTRIAGVLETAHWLTAEQRKQIRDSWRERHVGAANYGGLPVFEGGFTFKPVSMTLEDAEWIAARQFSVEEIARLFRVPPTIIGDLRHGNFSNSVEMSRQFVTLTLRRHLAAWEQAISRQLLTDAGRGSMFAEHSVEGLLRGDSLNRAQFYQHAITDGWMSVDEVRKLENLPARPAGV